MKTAILTIGISGSGKSSWTSQFLQEKAAQNEWWLEISRDSIRKDIFLENTPGSKESFSWGAWNMKWEKKAKSRWKEKIERMLDPELPINGIVFSDTNLNEKTRTWLVDRLSAAEFVIEYKHFPISYEEAVKRDRGRIESVGAFVIAEQLQKYQQQFPREDVYVPDKTKPRAFIVDLDGTLAHSTNRGFYDWSKVESDTLDYDVSNVIFGLKQLGFSMIVMSGRDAVCRDKTREWLNYYGLYPDLLLMRPAGDMRKDHIIKSELFDAHIRHHYYVKMVFDDRPQVIRYWQSIEIKTFILGNPWVEF